MKELLGRFGFHSIKAHNEVNDIIYATAEDIWGFILTLPPGATISGMSKQTRARFKDEYLVKLQATSRPDGLHASLGVLYTLAKR